ncbi:MAG: hypothetical protein H6718_14750 [Polyangiaceae bacterium]|nr:hypothetical protein [Polyangiaceae bacterium]MCB9606163.1 hypothetical protein [Polyangiaceae bacterium]
MQLKTLLSVATAGLLAALAAPGCSSDDGGDGNGQSSNGVGSSCTQDSDCTGYTNPKCISELYPTKNLILDPSNAGAAAFEDLVIPFNGGYCTNDLGDLTEDDIKNMSCTPGSCGDSGECYQPLAFLSAEDVASLQGTLPFVNIEAFGDLGLCLQPCAGDGDCRTDEGYKCTTPLKGLLDVLGEEKTFCMVDKDYGYLLQGG